jgi:hypothetical protein
MTVPDSVTELGRSLVAALPPAFVVLCIINLAFLGMVMWFLNHNIQARLEILDKIITKCLAS